MLKKNNLTLLATAATLSISVGAVSLEAIPSNGVQTDNNCAVCHGVPIESQPVGISLAGEKDGRIVTAKMMVTETGVATDLNVQLDGETRGSLTTVRGSAGSTLQLLIDVLDGVDAHAVQLKQLENGGQLTSMENHLTWSATDVASAGWEQQELDGSPPYFTTIVLGGEDPKQYNFALEIDESTPSDIYELAFAVAGQDELGLFYQEEFFYLDVSGGTGSAPSTQLINISTRGLVGTGSDIMIAGFVIEGIEPQTVLIRAAGPTLGGLGVPGTIEDPVLTLTTQAGEQIASNTNWGDAANTAEIATAAETVGAFPYDAGSSDAAMLITLETGGYTAQVSGNAGGTGATLVEVYKVQ